MKRLVFWTAVAVVGLTVVFFAFSLAMTPDYVSPIRYTDLFDSPPKPGEFQIGLTAGTFDIYHVDRREGSWYYVCQAGFSTRCGYISVSDVAEVTPEEYERYLSFYERYRGWLILAVIVGLLIFVGWFYVQLRKKTAAEKIAEGLEGLLRRKE